MRSRWHQALRRFWRRSVLSRRSLAPVVAVGRPRRRVRRFAMIVVAICGAVAIAAVLALGLLHARLSQGPLVVESLSPRIAQALNDRFGAAYRFTLGETRIAQGREGLEIEMDALAVADATGRPVLSAPGARMSLDPLALLAGSTVPRWLEVRDVDLRLSVQPDGALALSTGAPDAAGVAPAEVDAAASGDPMAAGGYGVPIVTRTAAAMRSLLDSFAGPGGPLDAVERLGLTHGRLLVQDRLLGTAIAFEGVDLDFDKTGAVTRAQLAADGPNGRWSAKAVLSNPAAGTRSLDISVSELSFDEIALVAGIRKPGFVLDMPISGRLRLALDEAGALVDAGARFALGAGVFKLDDKDHEPLIIDEITGDLKLDATAGRIDVASLAMEAGPSHFDFSGSVTPPAARGGDWTLALDARPGAVFGPERPGEAPLAIGTAELAARFQPATGAIVIDGLKLRGPAMNSDLSGQIDLGDVPHLALVMSARNMPATNLVRLWPSHVVASVRAWFLRHLKSGTLESLSLAVDFDAAALKVMIEDDGPAPDGAIHLEGKVVNAVLDILPGLPPLTGIEATGALSGRKARIELQRAALDAGEGRKMTVGESHFVIPDTALKPAPAQIRAKLSGGLDALAELLATDALKRYAGLPADASMVHGQIDGLLAIDLKLGIPPPAEEPVVRVNANVTNLAIDKLIGKEKLENGSLSIVADKTGIRATGTGKVFGAQALIELKKLNGEPGEASLGIVLDEAARGKHGFAVAGLTGPVGARIQAPLLQTAGATSAHVDLDLVKAGLENIVPGFSKPAGKPAKASFDIDGMAKGTILDKIEFDAGPVSVRGSALLAPDGGFVSAKLSQLKFSAGDEMKADIARAGEGLKISLRGSALDARPLLQSMTNASNEGGGGKETASQDVDLDLKSARATGQNKQVLAGAELHLQRKGGALRQFQLAGKLAGSAVTGELAGPATIAVKSDNAGAFLSFLDLYKRMEGGDLSASVHFGAGQADGQVAIHDFLLRDEPALRKLVTEGATVRDEANAAAPAHFDPGLVEFAKLQVSFVKTGARIDLRDGVMYGPQIGTTLEGAVDFSRNFVDVKGTFVPAYGLNNFFARIPVLGIFLGGGAHEGLFAVNFRVSGPASAPTLSINPLSAIAPGFLRKIFGAGEIPGAFQPKTGQ